MKSTSPTPELEHLLKRYSEGPFSGIFTDGACSGNPGPGGWSAVWVKDNQFIAQSAGAEGQTTNNRMEFCALIAAYEMITPTDEVIIWSDSNNCVQTINEWAKGWKARGWRRKTGPVLNLDLVEKAYDLSLLRPKATVKWIKAHNGSRWNEYADQLAVHAMNTY